MTWLRIEDDMLDHPKWRRALRAGGDTTLIVWWRLYSWCARFLTDGEVPSDMVEEVADIGFSKVRARALQALVDASLLTRRDDGGVSLNDYLQRNPSKATVLADRERRAQSEKNRRGASSVAGHGQSGVPKRVSVPSHPIPFPSHPKDPPVVPPPAEPERSERGADTRGPVWWQYPKGWRWSADTASAAHIQGVSLTELQEHVDYWTTHEFARPVTDLDAETRRSLPNIVKRKSTQAYKQPKHGSAQPNAGKTGWENAPPEVEFKS